MSVFQNVGIAFDLDGTLVDTAPDIIGALNALITKRGIAPFDLDKARPMIGRGAKALLTRAFEVVNVPLTLEAETEILPEFLHLYRLRIDETSKPYPGLIEALNTLTSEGAILCVATNKPQDLADLLLDKLDLTKYFKTIIGADKAPVKKPDPSHFFAALETHQTQYNYTVMVGDSITDHETAINAGAISILMTHGYSELDLATLKSDALLDHFDSLVPSLRTILEQKADLYQPS